MWIFRRNRLLYQPNSDKWYQMSDFQFRSVKRKYSTSSSADISFQINSLTFDVENLVLKNNFLEDLTFEFFFKQYLSFYLKRLGWDIDFDSGKCDFLQVDESSVLISKDEDFFFVSKVDFQQHTLVDKTPFYSLCVFNNSSIKKHENSIFYIHVSFINFFIETESFHIYPINNLYEIIEYLDQYIVDNKETFIMRINDILCLLKKIYLLDSLAN